MRHQPRKRFGQNFLVDHQIINQIISTISPKNDDSIVEIAKNEFDSFLEELCAEDI